jgi:tetratricopeptide (TPR) repeat protein
MNHDALAVRYLWMRYMAVAIYCLHLFGCESGREKTLTPKDNLATAPVVGPLQLAREKQQKGDVEGAIQAYTEYLKTDPLNVPALGNRASLFAAQGKDTLALQDYSMILDIDPSHETALHKRAELHVQMGHDLQALTDYDQLIARFPHEAALFNARGAIQMGLGKHRAAFYDFNTALEKRAGWEEALLNRAAAAYALGEFDRAQSDYETVLAMRPTHAAAHNGLGLIQQFVYKNKVAAEVQYRKALQFDPNHAEAWYNIAFLEAERGQTLKAIDDFGTAIRLDSSYTDAWLNRGMLYMNARTFDAALVDFEMATKQRPGDSYALLLRGWARCENGARTQGCLDLAAAIENHEIQAKNLIQRYCK